MDKRSELNFYHFLQFTVGKPELDNHLITVFLNNVRSTQRQISENICSEDDLRSRIFGTFVVKFLACLPLLEFSNIQQMV